MHEAARSSTQQCTRCRQTLDVNEFGFKYPYRDYRVQRCRGCVRELARMHYHRDPAAYKARAATNNKLIRVRNREKLREFLFDAECADCGLSELAILEFDHRDPRQKRHDVSSLVGRPHSWTTILKEIAKCDIVCANCHRYRTARYFGWRRLVGLEELVLPSLPKRGTPDYERIKWTRSALARKHRNRSHIYAHLRQHPCQLCGEDDPVVLEFDHVRDKLRDVTVIASFGGWSDLLAEMEKCRVLCANCHRRHTARQADRLR